MKILKEKSPVYTARQTFSASNVANQCLFILSLGWDPWNSKERIIGYLIFKEIWMNCDNNKNDEKNKKMLPIKFVHSEVSTFGLNKMKFIGATITFRTRN